MISKVKGENRSQILHFSAEKAPSRQKTLPRRKSDLSEGAPKEQRVFWARRAVGEERELSALKDIPLRGWLTVRLPVFSTRRPCILETLHCQANPRVGHLTLSSYCLRLVLEDWGRGTKTRLRQYEVGEPSVEETCALVATWHFCKSGAYCILKEVG